MPDTNRRLPRLDRRHLQLVLAALWLLDGALQLQPFMLSSGFADKVLAPAAGGQPALVAVPVRWSASLVASHHVLADVAFAGVQLAIGLALLVRPLARLALAASAAWATGVWFVGEGLGGVLGGHSSLLAGAPGAAAIYVVLSVLAWPPRPPLVMVAAPPGWLGAWRARLTPPRASGEGGGAALAPWVAGAWAVVWIGGAVLRCLPAQRSASAIAAALVANAAGSPRWLAGWDHAVAAWVVSTGGGLVVALVVVQVLVGVGALVRGPARLVATATGVALALALWVLGQGMGQITGGQATDPNAGVLLALLGVAVLSAGPAPRRHLGQLLRLPRAVVAPGRRGERPARQAS